MRGLFPKILRVVPTGPDDDRKHGRDYQVVHNGVHGFVAARLRRLESARKYRDLTIRTRRASGVMTERTKILRGDVPWYVYGWVGELGIEDWIAVDCKTLVDKALMLGRKEIVNRDGGSAFIAIPLKELERAGAVIEHWPPAPPTLWQPQLAPAWGI